jgi:peptidyl-prolyl cis-trans isomerase C
MKVHSHNLIIRFFKEPLVLLLLLGVGIYGGWRFSQSRALGVEEATIHVSAGQIEGMVAQWEQRWNRPPTREEIDGLIQRYVRDEMLYRQAVAMGLDKNDPVARLRTVQKLEFLTNDLADAQQPSDADLKQYFADNEASYRSPDLISFFHVFFNPDARKNATLLDAEAELEKLRAAGEPDPAVLVVGDRFMGRSHFVSVDETGVAREMGAGFAESVMKLEPGQWHDPVLSGFGVHLVYVYGFQEGVVQPFDAVENQVLAAWHEEKREEMNARFLEGLRARYEIVIDEVAADLFITPPVEGASRDDPDGDGSQGSS